MSDIDTSKLAKLLYDVFVDDVDSCDDCDDFIIQDLDDIDGEGLIEVDGLFRFEEIAMEFLKRCEEEQLISIKRAEDK